MHYVTNLPTLNPYETEIGPTNPDTREPVSKETTTQLLVMLITLSQKMDKEANTGTCPHHNHETFPNKNHESFPNKNHESFPYRNGGDFIFDVSKFMTPVGEGFENLPKGNGNNESHNNRNDFFPTQRNEKSWPSEYSDILDFLNLPKETNQKETNQKETGFPQDFPKKEVGFDTSKMDMYTLIMMLQEERVGLLESQIQDQSTRMKGINNEIKEIGNTIGKVNELSSGLKEGKDKTEIDPKLRQELTDMGIDVPEGKVSKDQLNAFAENLKSKRDGLNNDSQMEMIRLQGLINKQQQAYQLITNIQKKEHDMLMATINKIN